MSARLTFPELLNLNELVTPEEDCADPREPDVSLGGSGDACAATPANKKDNNMTGVKRSELPVLIYEKTNAPPSVKYSTSAQLVILKFFS